MQKVPLIQVDQVHRTYQTGAIEVHALRGVDLTLEAGEFTALAGPSGSGKSTLLNIIGGLDTPTSGQVALAGRPIGAMSGNQLSDFRRDHIGFVFQSFNLVPVLSVRENIEYIMLLQGIPPAQRRARVAQILAEVGLEGLEERRPPHLSGGQQQRVAVARAVVAEPAIVLADEPTANLDSATGRALLDMMAHLNQQRGTTFLFSTHDTMIMERAHRLVLLQDGQIACDEVR
ncbi:MAG: ATP-binding cassette domain-containing protein [Candidatus Latescibacteria bacterium]|nr:ATP-binding cassette domain-containing protein [Candidatus Latescibacterota bacterium]